MANLLGKSESKGFLWRDMNTVYLYLSLIVASLAIAFIIVKFGMIAGIIIIAMLIGAPVAVYSIMNVKFGMIMLLIISFFIIKANQMVDNVPLGIVIDAYIAALLLGVIIRRFTRGDYSLAKGPVSVFVWIWLVYNCLEFFNPIASTQAWFFVIRTIAVRTMFYFIALEAIEDMKSFKQFLVVWISFSFIGGAYGLFQEFYGLLPSERAWVMADPDRFKLFYNWGRFRVWAFFSDPTVFGILMAFSGVFCLAVISGPLKLSAKIMLGVAAAVMLLSTVYSGTRTSYAMIPAGFLFYALITFQKKVLAITTVFFLFGAFVIFSDIKNLGPLIGANPLERVRSAFKPSDDPSYIVRLENQARIKPFIQSHPFGAGVGSIGIWGSRFSPDSALAGFAPDSTYVRVAVELGWVGLFIYCGFFLSVMIVGIRNYYRIKDPMLKTFAAGAIAAIYSIAIANYPQQAVIQVPNVFIFYALIASIVKLPELDAKIQRKNT